MTCIRFHIAFKLTAKQMVTPNWLKKAVLAANCTVLPAAIASSKLSIEGNCFGMPEAVG